MKINSKEDLKKEKRRLKLELQETELLLREDMEWIKTELEPIRVAGKVVGNALVNKNKGLVNDGVRMVIDTFIKNVVLSRAGWITRMVVPYILKNISTNYVKEKKPEVLATLKNFLSRARKATNHHPEYYDTSTAAETEVRY